MIWTSLKRNVENLE